MYLVLIEWHVTGQSWMADNSVEFIKTDNARYEWFQVFWGLLGLALFAVTDRLWIPSADFPQIPVFEFLIGAPVWIDSAAFAVMIGSLLVWVCLSASESVSLWRVTGNKQMPHEFSFTKGGRDDAQVLSISKRIALFLFIAASCSIVLLNQHRLQPWLYQFIVFAVLMLACRRDLALSLMRWITISIYFYSAISKFDFQFVTTLGRDFLDTTVGLMGVETDGWPDAVVSGLVVLFPLFELLMAVGLVFRRTRRWAMAGIVAMHGMLLLILGPLGLGHQPGVLVWNMYLLGQVVFLFGARDETWQTPDDLQNELLSSLKSKSNWRSKWLGDWRWLGTGTAMFVILFPLSVPWNGCDHWLAWEVYAPRTSRAQLEIGQADISRLPQQLQALCGPPNETTGFCSFWLDRWSIDTLGAPIYPEDRFQFAVAASLLEREKVRQFRLHVGGLSDRWTGKRDWQTLNRTDEIERFRDQFFLNSKSR